MLELRMEHDGAGSGSMADRWCASCIGDAGGDVLDVRGCARMTAASVSLLV